jgi:hypothetical protein
MDNYQNNDELAPEDKLEALRRLQKINFLDPGEEEQMKQLQAAQLAQAPAPSAVQPAQAAPAPATQPQFKDVLLDALKRRKLQEDQQLNGLFPPSK